MRYFVGFMLLIALLIFLIVLVVMGRGGGPAIPTKTLASFSTTDAKVSFLNDGMINSASEHRQILITVDRDYVVYKELIGYNGRVAASRKFNNTEVAYNNFLSALGHAGFTLINKDPALQNEKGYCPLGQRYIFEMTEGSEQLQRSWATSCGDPKTFLGSLQVTIDLFQAQVPQYQELTANVELTT